MLVFALVLNSEAISITNNNIGGGPGIHINNNDMSGSSSFTTTNVGGIPGVVTINSNGGQFPQLAVINGQAFLVVPADQNIINNGVSVGSSGTIVNNNSGGTITTFSSPNGAVVTSFGSNPAPSVAGFGVTSRTITNNNFGGSGVRVNTNNV